MLKVILHYSQNFIDSFCIILSPFHNFSKANIITKFDAVRILVCFNWLENIISKRNYVLVNCFILYFRHFVSLFDTWRSIRIKILKEYWIFKKIRFFPSHVNKMTHFNILTVSKTFHLPPLKIIISDDKILANVSMTKNWAFCMSLLLSQNCSNPVILFHDHLATIMQPK